MSAVTEPRIPGSLSISGAAFATLVPVSDLPHSRHYPRSPAVLSPTRSAVNVDAKKPLSLTPVEPHKGL